MSDNPQPLLFDIEEEWRKEWVGMPEFIQDDLTPWKQIVVSFAGPADMAAFAVLVDQTITPNTRSIWFPDAEMDTIKTKRYGDES
jgi:hypothetical protein